MSAQSKLLVARYSSGNADEIARAAVFFASGHSSVTLLTPVLKDGRHSHLSRGKRVDLTSDAVSA